jgi:hypothetical protein
LDGNPPEIVYYRDSPKTFLTNCFKTTFEELLMHIIRKLSISIIILMLFGVIAGSHIHEVSAIIQPKFTASDMLISGTDLHPQTQPNGQTYTESIWTNNGGGVRYGVLYLYRQDSTTFHVEVELSMIFYNDVSWVDTTFNAIVQETNTFTQAFVDNLVSEYHANIIQFAHQTDYNSLIYTILNINSDGSKTTEDDASRVFKSDDGHFVISVMVNGFGIDSARAVTELQDITDAVESHARMLTEETVNPASEVKFTISYLYGVVYIQRGGIGNWIRAEKGMQIYPNDAIKVPHIDKIPVIYEDTVTITCSSDYLDLFGIVLGEGEVVFKVSQTDINAPIRVNVKPDTESSQPGDVIYFHGLYENHPSVNIYTDQAEVVDHETDFELLGNTTATTLYTFGGAVKISDLNQTSTVTVGANQMSTVFAGKTPANPISFDPATVQKWWSLALQALDEPSTSPAQPTKTSTPLPTQSSSSRTPQPTQPEMFPRLPALVTTVLPYMIIGAVAVILGVVFMVVQRRKKQGFPPPPPPPPPGY